MIVKLETKHIATLTTTEAVEYVGDEPLFDELVARYGLHPIKGSRGKRGGRGQKYTRWLVASIDHCLKLAESHWVDERP